MPCNPSDLTLNIPAGPVTPLPDLGIPIAPLSADIPSFDLPTDMIEDLLRLMEQLGALFPSGLFKAFPDLGMKAVLDFIANILSQLAPFLSLYNFFMALIKMIVCIIEVLCAIPNPFAMISKLQKLFSECIPLFVQMFPWLALLAMIIAFLLLILFLIAYLIEKILGIIEDIIRNIMLFAEAAALQDADATLAAAQKISSLLCMIQNLMAIFLAIAALFAIIEALMAMGGFSICDDADEDGCCSEAICPAFIKNSTGGITTTGTMVYYPAVNTDVTAFGLPAAAFNLPPIRSERWQLYSTETNTYDIIDIITPTSIGQTFYPATTFTKDTPPRQAPYTVDVRLFTDPLVWGPSNYGLPRYFRFKDCIVVNRPYDGYYSYNNNVVETGNNGTFAIEGGLCFEDDGVTRYEIGGRQATLNTFLHETSLSSTLPIVDDGTYFGDVEFTWKPECPSLVSYNLISIGCVPEVGMEKAIQNAVLVAEGIQSAADKFRFRLPNGIPDGELVPASGLLPNVTGAEQCVQTAIDTFKKNISAESAAVFQATVLTCLNDLKEQTEVSYCAALLSAISSFKSTAALDTAAQFTTRPITISVTLRDASGTVISNSIPASCADNVADLLKGTVTLGNCSDFTYDGYTDFTAEITSGITGEGILTVSFDGNVFSTITAGNPSIITETEIPYSFVSVTEIPAVRRDASDTAQDR